MKKTMAVLMLCVVCFALRAQLNFSQPTISSLGTYNSAGGNNFSSTTGEVTVFTGTASLVFTQGFQQPHFNFVCSIEAAFALSDSAVSCPLFTATLQASPNGGGYTYQWRRNNANISGANSATHSISQIGNYSVVVSNGSCTDISEQTYVRVRPTLTPRGWNYICPSAPTLAIHLADYTRTNATAFQWQRNGVNIGTGGNDSVYVAAVAGTYRCVITYAGGCQQTTAEVCRVFSNTNCVAKNDGEDDMEVSITEAALFPNPNTDDFTVQLNSTGNGEAQLRVLNSLRQCIWQRTETLSEGNNLLHINMNAAPAAGLYFLQLQTREGLVVKQFAVGN